MHDQNTAPAIVATAPDGTPTTTSLIIAEGTDTKHQNVRELIEDNRTDFEEFGVLRFETGKPSAQGGRPQKWFILNEEQAALLMTFMRNTAIVREFKKRLVRAFFDLRNTVAVPQSREERFALALADAADMLAAKDEKIAELEAPAKSWQRLADANGDFSVAEAAKILSRDPFISTGRDRLFQFMAEQKWIFKSRNPRGGWEAYQTAVDTGRLVERPAKPFLNSKTGEYELPAPTIRVTAKGIGKLHELLGGTEEIHFIAGEAA